MEGALTVLTVRALFAVHLAEGALLRRFRAAFLTFFRFIRLFRLGFRLVLLLFDALAGLDACILLAEELCGLRILLVLARQLFNRGRGESDIRHSNDRAAGLADRRAEFDLAVGQLHAGNIRLLGVERTLFRRARAGVACEEHASCLVGKAHLAHQLIAVGELACAACKAEHSQYRIIRHVRPPVPSAARAGHRPFRAR